MVVVFRSSDFAPEDRAEATRVAMQEQSVPSWVLLDDPDRVDSLMQVWPFGGACIFRAEMTGFRLLRSPRQVRTGPAEMLSITVQERCTGLLGQYGNQHALPPGTLFLTDLNSPYDYGQPAFGSSSCLQVPIEELGLPHEVVRDAAARLPASPLYTLVTTHIGELTRQAERLATGPAAAELGSTATDLARALLASAYDIEYARGRLAEVLLPRIRGYVRRHLRDPDLTPARIAHAHDISVRRLFRLRAEAGFSLEQWIIAERLAGARDDLARDADTPIALVGRRWGFVNDAHFSRRFREAYGQTPREWRKAARCADRTEPCAAGPFDEPGAP